MAYRFTMASALLLQSILFGCGGDAIDLTPRSMSADAGLPDAAPMALDASDQPLMDGGVPAGRWPSLELFVENVQPIMVGCGNLACHKAETVSLDDQFMQFTSGPGGNISDEQADSNFQEFTQDRLIDYDDPNNSKFLRHHPSGHSGFILQNSMTNGLVIAWIEDALTAPEDKMEQVRPIDYRCDELEITDQQRPWRDSYEQLGINAALVGSPDMPGGRCGGSDCHAGPNAGRLLFAPAETPCSGDYNFLEALAIVNRSSPLDSSLLVEPLGEPSQETGQIEHGGRVVFNGRDDPDYIKLRRWIEGL